MILYNHNNLSSSLQIYFLYWNWWLVTVPLVAGTPVYRAVALLMRRGEGGRRLYHSSLHMVAGARTASPLHSSRSGYQHVLGEGNGMTESVGYVFGMEYTVTPVRIYSGCIWIEGLGSISGVDHSRSTYNCKGPVFATSDLLTQPWV